MAQEAVGRPAGEADFADEPRLDPVGLAEVGSLHARKRLRFPLERFQAGVEIAQGAIVKAGADLAGVAQRLDRVVHAEQQSAEADARSGRIGEAGDDEFLALGALDLEPRACAPRAVRIVAAFCNDSFQSRRAGFGEELFALVDPVLAVAQDRLGVFSCAAGEKFFQETFALDQRH